MKNTLSAIAVALTLSSGAAYAQNDPATMDVGLSMLELATARQFTLLGIDVDPMTLNLNQLATIKAVLGSSDYNVSDKASQVKAIIAKN